MTRHSSKLTPSVAAGLSLLAIQGLTAPLVLPAMFQRPDASPRWLTALYIALEFGAMAAGAIVAFGIRSKRRAAFLAPALLLAPWWLAVAVASPWIYSGLGAVGFAGVSLAMGTATALPFATPAGRALFTPAAESSAPSSLATAAK